LTKIPFWYRDFLIEHLGGSFDLLKFKPIHRSLKNALSLGEDTAGRVEKVLALPAAGRAATFDWFIFKG
jgi:hypothetical protein